LGPCDQVAPAANSKKGSLLIPDEEVTRVMSEVAVQPCPTGLQKLAGIKNIVEGWCAPLSASQRPPCLATCIQDSCCRCMDHAC
jgi:hypothetical protein